VGNQWYWIPDRVNTTPSYAPALVAFVPLNDSNQIGWVPLGPGDSYAPRYYDDNWQPRYLTRTNIVPAQLINFGIPGAVTVVPVDAWGRAIDPRSIKRIDQQRLASVRSTLDPLTLTPLRNAVIHSAWGRGKIDLPPGIAKKLNDTRVFVGTDIRESRIRKNLAKSMRVERVSDQAKNQKFKVKDERQEVQQVRQLEQQQRKETRAEDKTQRKAQQQPKGERVGNPAKHQPQSEQPNKHEAKPQSPGASKHERKQEPPAAAGQRSQAAKAKVKAKASSKEQ
jgi:hypothetical protein